MEHDLNYHVERGRESLTFRTTDGDMYRQALLDNREINVALPTTGLMYRGRVVRVEASVDYGRGPSWFVVMQSGKLVSSGPSWVAEDPETGIRMRSFNPGSTINVRVPERFNAARISQIVADGMLQLKSSTRLVQHLNREYGKAFSLPVKENTMAPANKNKAHVRNRFYVAADRMLSESEQGTDNTIPQSHGCRWSKKTLAQAIAHAEEILDKEPAKETVAIVQIVRVVRRKRAPVVVEVVR